MPKLTSIMYPTHQEIESAKLEQARQTQEEAEKSTLNKKPELNQIEVHKDIDKFFSENSPDTQ